MPSMPNLLRRLLAAITLSTAAWLLVLAPAAAAINPDDLLPVDEAFALRVQPGADAITLEWDIADGYYLYRHRISVASDAGFVAQPLQLPPGEPHEDEFFGHVETYRHALRAVLPGDARAEQATLTVKYQGCADLGICYPPQTRTLSVRLPQLPPPRRIQPLLDLAAGSAAAPLLGKLDGAGAMPLPAEQAFAFEAIAGDGNTLLLRFTPANGYYLYRDRSSFKLDAEGIRLGQPQWPAGVNHHDEHFGDVVVYFKQIDVPLPLQRTHPRPAKVRLTATFQGCQTDGICYPPMTRTVTVALPEGAQGRTALSTAPQRDDAGDNMGVRGDDDMVAADATPQRKSSRTKSGDTTGVELPAGAAPTPPAPLPTGEGSKASSPQARNAARGGALSDVETESRLGASEDQRLAAALSGAGRWWALLGFLGAGLLLAFTPCVLPMIPILSGLIAGASAGRGGRLGTGHALALSGVYVLANALVFTAAGVVAGLIGANLQVAFQNPWVIAAFAALFVALSLSMFGLFELQLPAALRARLGAVADRQRGGSWAGVAAMGALSALIVGPCVAPPLAAAVLYIGQTHDPVFGGASLFLLAIGMGLPLLAFGVAAGRGLPTSGPWMTVGQRVFGFVFLGLAIWMLGRILPGAATLALWGLLELAAAAWAFGLATPDTSQRVSWLVRFAGLTLAVFGAAQLLGALSGGSDPLRPLADLRRGAPVAELDFRMIKSVDDLDRALASAQAAGQPLLLDFYADWCVACKEMEKYTFSQPTVHAALGEFVLLKADVTANDATDQALMQRLGIIGPPATLFYVDGSELRGMRLIGFEQAEDFVERAQGAAVALTQSAK